jgi:hypothetical protein
MPLVFAFSSRLLDEDCSFCRSVAQVSFLLRCDTVLSDELFLRFWRIFLICRIKLDRFEGEGTTVLWNYTCYDTSLHLRRPGFSNNWNCRTIHSCLAIYTVMHQLITGIHSEKWVVRRFCPCANVTESTYTNLDSIAYYTPSLYLAYCS